MWGMRSPHLLMPVAFACLLGGTALAGQQTTASIQGTVTETGTGVALEGATVMVTTAVQPHESVELGSATTDADGEYALEIDAAEGPVEVLVEAAGPQHVIGRHGGSNLERCRFGPWDNDTSGSITLSAGDAPTGVDIELEPGGWIAGTTKSAEVGDKLDGVTVRIYDSEGLNCSHRFYDESDSDGQYRTGLALPAGEYYLVAVPLSGDNFVAQAWSGFPCPYGVCPKVQGDPIEVETGSATSDIDFELAPGATIKGTLLPDDIQRLVFLFNGAGVAVRPQPVPDYGQPLPADEWSINGLPGGSYYLQFGPFSLSEGSIDPDSPYVRILHNGLPCPLGGCDRARGVPITIPDGSTLELPATTLETGGWVEGVLVDGDTGEPPADLSDGTSLGNYDVIDLDGNVAAGGWIEVDGGELVLKPSAAMPPGKYRIRTYDSFRGEGVGYRHFNGFEGPTLAGYSDAMYPDVACAGLGCDASESETITVTQDEGTFVTVELSSGSRISGAVTDAASDEGIEDAVVKLVNAENELLAATITKEDGHYEFGGFPAGDYYLRTSMAGHTGTGTYGYQLPYFDKVYGADGECSEQRCDPATGSAITLDGDSDAAGIELAVSQGPVISGRVIFALTGMPIQRGVVHVRDEDGGLVGSYRIRPSTARYQTTALSPGEYSLEADVSPAYADISTDPEGPQADNLDDDSGSGDGSLVVTVGTSSVEADLTVIDASLDQIFESDFQTD